MTRDTSDQMFAHQMRNLRYAATIAEGRDRPDRDDIAESCRWAASRLTHYRDQEAAALSRPAPPDDLACHCGDGATLRGYIHEYGETPAMTASNREHWKRRAEAAEAALATPAPVVEGRCTVCRDTALPCMTSHAGRRVPCPDCQTASMCQHWNGGQFRCIRTAPVAAPAGPPAGFECCDPRGGAEGCCKRYVPVAAPAPEPCPAGHGKSCCGAPAVCRAVLARDAAPAPETPAPDAMPEIREGDVILMQAHGSKQQAALVVEAGDGQYVVQHQEFADVVSERRVLGVARVVWRRQEAQP